WDKIVGADRNLYFIWDPEEQNDPVKQPGPPRSPLPRESDIQLQTLEVGGPWPGAYEGVDASIDTHGNVYLVSSAKRKAGQKQLTLNGTQAKELLSSLGHTGKFKVTPLHHAVLYLQKVKDRWETRYAGCLAQALETPHHASILTPQQLAALKPGDSYQGALKDPITLNVAKRSGNWKLLERIRGGKRVHSEESSELAKTVFGALRLIDSLIPCKVLMCKETGALFFHHNGSLRFLAQIRLTSTTVS
ncbi:MAG: hypothetical protein SNJ84_02170, partial [Verrucomicrobiia bacterium]